MISFAKLSNNTSLQVKFIVPIILISIISIIISLVYFYTTQKKQTDLLFSNIQKELHAKVDIAISQKGETWLANAILLSINESIVNGLLNNNKKRC
ncbi:MAG: hypothetical protein HXX81_06910 [Campylobacterales bacterium]|nr:hypothetical protein [Campylobacterales bacterium]